MDTRHDVMPEPLPLPFDDGADEAVPFVLTAAAHREVLGGQVPPLVAVDDVPDEDDGGTRRMQARALLRSGMPMSTVAAALGVDVEFVEEWTADLVDELARRRRRAARRTRAVPSQGPAAPQPGLPVGRAEVPRDRLLPGLAYAIAEVGEDAVSFVHDRVEPVALLLDALREAEELPARRVRVAVRLSPDLPADRTRAEVARRLGIDAETITVGRSAAGATGSVELRVDVRDAAAAQRVASWCGAEGSGLRGWDSNPQTFRLTADCSAS